MNIERIGENRYRVTENEVIQVMTLDEVMFLLNRPLKTEVNIQESMEEFWNSKPIYPQEE